jgi:membrane protein
MYKLFTKTNRARVIQLFTRTFLKWQQDKCLEMGAALAYYALFSLFPLILVILSIFGVVIGPNTYAYDQILFLARSNLPSEAYSVVESTLIQLNQGSTTAGIVGFVTLLITASGFFGALNQAFDKIWKVQRHQPAAENLIAIARNFVLQKLFSFVLVLGTVILLFTTLISNIVIGLLFKILENFSNRVDFITSDNITFFSTLDFGSSFLTLIVVVTALLKILPSTWVAWEDVWLGGLITATLLTLLRYLVSNSIVSLGSRFQSYGVVGGVMVLLLWIYLTSQIFFLGGELTYVYARIFGSRCGVHSK